jgi:alkaline phosphatase
LLLLLKKDKAHKSIDDFVAFDNAIGEALKVVNKKETLAVVTADHSHMFSVGGNSLRGNQIYGLALTRYINVSDSNLTYTSILYGNGPGGLRKIRSYNLTNEGTSE